MKRLIYILIISICLFPNLIKGSECTNEQRERLQKLADNVTYTLEEMNNGNFSISFYGLSDEIRIYNPMNWMYYRNVLNSKFGEVTIPDLTQDTTYRFEIHSAINCCLVHNFRSITVFIPKQNPYYKDSVCEGVSNLTICQKWSKVDISYDEFVSRVNEYKEQQKDTINEIPIKENENNNFNFLDIYNKYYWPTFIGMISLLVLLIILWIRQNKKNKL